MWQRRHAILMKIKSSHLASRWISAAGSLHHCCSPPLAVNRGEAAVMRVEARADAEYNCCRVKTSWTSRIEKHSWQQCISPLLELVAACLWVCAHHVRLNTKSHEVYLQIASKALIEMDSDHYTLNKVFQFLQVCRTKRRNSWLWQSSTQMENEKNIRHEVCEQLINRLV